MHKLINMNMELEVAQTPMRKIIKLQPKKDGPIITLRSNFDSGNMTKAEVGLNASIIITPAQDCAETQYESHSKGWFYFSVHGIPAHTKQKFVIKKMCQLSSTLKFHEYFKPVYKFANENWERVDHAIVFTKEDDTELHFQFLFQKNTEVFFAYTYPFTFQQCEKMLKEVSKEIKSSKNIYYKDQILIKTIKNKSIHLLTISSNDDKQDYSGPPTNDYLFISQQQRACQFKSTKKVIFVSARVHPGQAPSSHTFNGLLRFLLSKDARAHYLRKYFVFKLIPMLNPDGVADGNYRMDTLGQNLNRFYLNPDPEKQPAVFAVKKLGEFYKAMNKLKFYIDLHAHPQKKGNFIYGNSFDSHADQVQTQLFARILSLNCVEFDYFNSSFSKHHMNAKDRNQDLTKEGCGRVVFNTNLNVHYSYTMECGYTGSVYLNQIASIENGHRKFQKCSILNDQIENTKSIYYSNKKALNFTIRSYENLGKNILVSILDLFSLNPASRIPNTELKNVQGIKNDIRDHINKLNKDYKDNKFIFKLPLKQKMIATQKSIPKKHMAFRAPSIVSSKEFKFTKVRNKTAAKINIGIF